MKLRISTCGLNRVSNRDLGRVGVKLRNVLLTCDLDRVGVKLRNSTCGLNRVSNRDLDRVGVKLRDVLLLAPGAREDDGGAELAEANGQLAVDDPEVFAKGIGEGERSNALRALVEEGFLNIGSCCNVGGGVGRSGI